LVDALDASGRIGDDTEAVAAMADALLGARWGAIAVALEWKANAARLAELLGGRA
jgi:ADP-ribosylglycohydrolase